MRFLLDATPPPGVITTLFGLFDSPSPATPDPSSTETPFTVGEAVTGSMSNLVDTLLNLAIPFGAVTMLIGALMLAVNLGRRMFGGYVTSSFFGPIGMIIVGASIIGLSGVGRAAILDETLEGKPRSTPTPTATPSAEPTTAAPVPTVEPTQTPVAEPKPIQLPKVENLETLWFVLIAIAVLIAVVVVVIKMTATNRELKVMQRQELAARAKLEAKWKVFVDKHQKTKLAYLAAETDWDLLFNSPALSDPAEPQTANMLRTMVSVDQLDSELPLDVPSGTDLSTLAYPRAVTRFVTAWEAAVLNASLVGQRKIPHEERKLIEKIKTLIAIAESPGSSENERQVAYGQVQSLSKRLTSVRVPQAAFAAIEQKQMLMLETV